MKRESRTHKVESSWNVGLSMAIFLNDRFCSFMVMRRVEQVLLKFRIRAAIKSNKNLGMRRDNGDEHHLVLTVGSCAVVRHSRLVCSTISDLNE